MSNAGCCTTAALLATNQKHICHRHFCSFAICLLQQMEVTFDSMADWEAFLSSLPFQDHKAWTQRIQSMVVDGSPVWQVQRSVPLTVAGSSPAAAAATAGVSGAAAAARGSSSSSSSSAISGGIGKLVITDQVRTSRALAVHQLGCEQRQDVACPGTWQ
jgi:hypothetical protein